MHIVKKIFASGLIVLCFSAANAQQHKVFVEIFRNMDCANCVQPDADYQAYFAKHSDISPLIINYNNGVPSLNDPFYLASQTDVDARDNFYSESLNPSVFVNGADANGDHQGKVETKWETYTNAAATQTQSVFIISSFTQTSPSSGNLSITLKGDVTKPAKLYVALLEDQVHYHNTKSYGNPPNDLWDNVFRQMLPTSTGSPSFVFNGTKKFDIPINTEGMDWSLASGHLKAVVFVQDEAASTGVSHFVEGFNSFPLATLGVNESGTPPKLNIYPNPLIGTEQLRVSGSTGTITLSVTDFLGREVLRTSAEHATLSSLASGIYLVRVLQNGREVNSSKIVYSR